MRGYALDLGRTEGAQFGEEIERNHDVNTFFQLFKICLFFIQPRQKRVVDVCYRICDLFMHMIFQLVFVECYEGVAKVAVGIFGGSGCEEAG